ncbi:MAG: hypothetical protein RLZZ118_1908 [Bacteroidota bacterium]
MKKNILLLATLLLGNLLFAQDKVNKSSSNKNDAQVFLNLGGGFNNPFGPLGFGVDIAVHPHVMVGTGVGASSWGTKLMLKGMYFRKEHYHGGAFGISIHQSTGITLDSYKYQPANSGNTYSLNVNGAGITSANFLYANYRNIGRRSKFYLQTGIVAKLNNPTTSIKYAGTTIDFTDKKARSAIDISKPGGIVMNLGFLIALK